jgi:hypothetical protein
MPAISQRQPSQSSRRRLAAITITLTIAVSTTAIILSHRKSKPPSLGAQLEKITGAHTRIAWLRDHSSQQRDIFANGSRLSLMIFDSQTDQKPQQILAPGPLRRPLITPDGKAIVFSRLPAGSDPADPSSRASEICLLPWGHHTPAVLGKGQALDAWEAPDGTTWIYALESMDAAGPNHNGTALIRFPLPHPAQREPVLPRSTHITADNFQLNASGSAASVVMPWPVAGLIDLPTPATTTSFHPLHRGCWPSLAPDDSGLSWVFDGPHKRLRMVDTHASRTWDVSLSTVDGMDKQAAYHPRWSNHPAIITWTGPYPHALHKPKSAKGVSVFIGRLAASADTITSALRIDGNDPRPDLYPDVWIDNGSKSRLPRETLARAAKARPFALLSKAPNWPGESEGLVLAWKSARTDHSETEATPATPQLSGFAWLAREGTLCVQHGWADLALPAPCPTPEDGWGLTLRIEPLGQHGTILSSPFLSVSQESDRRLRIQYHGKAWLTSPAPDDGRPFTLCLSLPPGKDLPQCSIRSAPQRLTAADPQPIPAPTGLRLGADAHGQHPWHGFLSGLSLWNGPRAASLASRTADILHNEQSTAPPPQTITATIRIEKTSTPLTPEEIGSYRRAWTGTSATVVSVSQGTLPHERIAIAWWTIMDRHPIPNTPPPAGSELTVLLEPTASHPFFESERGADDFEEDLPWFLAIQPTPAAAR